MVMWGIENPLPLTFWTKHLCDEIAGTLSTPVQGLNLIGQIFFMHKNLIAAIPIAQAYGISQVP